MTILEWAKKYVNQYKWSIIPVKNKIPQLESWKEFQQRYPTETELKKWFQYTGNGIAIVTGRLSNLCVVDVDMNVIPISIKSVNSNIIVRTPQKGYHFYFKYLEGVKNYVKILENVDVRSEGGYVCAPPTPGYRFSNPYFSVRMLPDFPIRLLPKKEETKRNEMGWIGRALSELAEGNRDNTFTQIIGRLHHDGYSADDINMFLSPYAKICRFDELEEKIEHILKDYPNEKSMENNDSNSLQYFLQDNAPISWICKPIIGKGTIGFIAGLPETMKTWIMADLAIEGARGGKWLKRFPVSQGRVLFIDQERYKGEVQRRFKLLMNEKGLEPKDLEGQLILKSQTSTRIDLEDSFNAFRRRLTEISPSLVIIDSFATFHTREENNRRDIQIVLERLKLLRTEFGCTIIMIDHEGKGVFAEEEQTHNPNAFKMVGSIGKAAAAETVFVVRKLPNSGDSVMMYHVKSTIAPTIEPVQLTIQDTQKGILIS